MMLIDADLVSEMRVYAGQSEPYFNLLMQAYEYVMEIENFRGDTLEMRNIMVAAELAILDDRVES